MTQSMPLKMVINLLIVLALSSICLSQDAPAPVTLKAPFHQYAHAIASGEVTVVDEKTIEIKAFNYDGTGPSTWFVLGKGEGYKQEKGEQKDVVAIPDETQKCDKLKEYNATDIKLTIPKEIVLKEFDFMLVYCFRKIHTFGYILFPETAQRNYVPVTAPVDLAVCTITEKPDNGTDNGTTPETSVGKLVETKHNVSGEVFVIDMTTIKIKEFSYSGEGSSAKFVLTKNGTQSNRMGSMTPDYTFYILQDQNGQCVPKLPQYENQEITLKLADGNKFTDYAYFTIFEEEEKVSFGHVLIDQTATFPTGTNHGIPDYCNHTAYPPKTTVPHVSPPTDDPGTPPSSASSIIPAFILILTLGLISIRQF